MEKTTHDQEAPAAGGVNITAVAIGLGTLIVLWWTGLLPLGGSSKPKAKKVAVGKVTAAPKVVEENEDDFVVKMRKGKKRAAVFYGSQTGTANEYALRLAKEARSRFGFSSLVCDPEEYELDTLDKVPEDHLVMFVMATYGEGDPTDNATPFFKYIMDEEVEFSSGERSLSNLNYVILGLGNKTYQKYNAAARKLDARLLELGAHRIGMMGECDEIEGTEKGYLDWKDDMWKSMANRLDIEESDAIDIADFKVTELTPEQVHDSKVYKGELSEHALKLAGVETTPGKAPAGTYDIKNPYAAPVTVARELFSPDGERKCVHLELDISGTNLAYAHGDHVAIWPSSPDMAVERFLSVLGLTAKRDVAVTVEALDPTLAAVPFPTPSTYDAIFRYYLEIATLASRQTLALLAKYAPTPEAKACLERWGNDKEAYDREIVQPRVRLAEALQAATGDDTRDPHTATVWNIPFDRIISFIPRQKPRYYSISSSAKMYPNTIHATAVVLEYQAPTSVVHGNEARSMYGLASNYILNGKAAKEAGTLDNHAACYDGIPATNPTYRVGGPRDAHTRGNILRFPIHTRRSTFRLPTRTSIPVIMVGPGTGVAPFRGFVQERVALARTTRQRKGPDALKDWAPMYLFYGCRREEEDFLYRDEWAEYAKELDGKLEMHTAVSRGPNRKPDGSKIYVQDLMWQQRAELGPAIANGTYVYICGDGKHMVKDVEACLTNIIEDYRGCSLKDASDELKLMKDRKRFLTDTWS